MSSLTSCIMSTKRHIDLLKGVLACVFLFNSCLLRRTKILHEYIVGTAELRCG
jgi:hypothetical protein